MFIRNGYKFFQQGIRFGSRQTHSNSARSFSTMPPLKNKGASSGLALSLSLGLMGGGLVAHCASKQSLSSMQHGKVDDFLLTAEAGNLDGIKSFIAQGCSVNLNNSEGGFTPLMYAANEGHFDVVKYLIKHGAQVDLQTWRSIGGSTALMYAANEGHINIVKYLVENGAQVNFQGTWGHTPLMEAVCGNNIEVVEYLIERGADISAQSFGSTPLIHAAWHNKFESMKCLIEHGAEVNAQNNEGWSALTLAIRNENSEAITYLIERGAKDPNAMRFAVDKGNPEVFQCVLDNMNKVSAQAKQNTIETSSGQAPKM